MENFSKALEVEKKRLWARCPTCSELPRTGRILDEFESGCGKGCLGKMLKYVSYLDAGIPSEFWNLDLEDYKGDRKVLEVVKKYTLDLVGNYEKGHGILFYGGHGTGKSLLASSILKKACEEQVYKVKMRPLYDIIDLLKKSYDDDSTEIIDELSVTDFYCIEDTGLEYRRKDSEYVAKEFDRLFQIRRRKSLPTLMTVSYSLNQIEITYGEHILSTFYSCMKPLRCQGNDFRKERLKSSEETVPQKE
jgi:DNA replication protein DnaC